MSSRGHTGRAYGLELRGSFSAPGLWSPAAPALRSPGARLAALEIVPRAFLDRPPADRSERLLARRCGPGGPLLTLDRDGERGFRVAVDGFGAYAVTSDGSRVLLAPPDRPAWLWQRLLTAQVLPLAALLHGLELLHASAVAIGGGTVGILGPSGAGKTTLAMELLRRGGAFVTDDVLAVELDPEGPVAHPGPALVNLADLEAGAGPSLARELGRDDSGARLLLPRTAPALPLAGLFFLRRLPRARGARLSLRLEQPGARTLLGAGFLTAVRTPDRLRRWLDACAAMAATVPMYTVTIPEDTAAPRVAETILEAASEAVAA